MVIPVNVKSDKGLVLLWSVNAAVGLNSPNKQVDVELIQLAYLFRLASPKATKTAEELAAYKKIRPGVPCNGRPDDPLVQAIVAHQKARRGVQDGRVSPFTESHTVYTSGDGQHNMMGVTLMFGAMSIMPDAYPRLDKSTNPPCPPVLKAAIVSMCNLS